jgi:hypothetical protein
VSCPTYSQNSVYSSDIPCWCTSCGAGKIWKNEHPCLPHCQAAVSGYGTASTWYGMRQGRSQFETSSYYCTLASAITLIAHYPTLHSILHFFSDARVGGRNRCNSKSCPVGKLAASFAAKCGGVIVIVTSRHGYRLRNQYNLTGSHLGRGRGRTLSTLRSTANLLLWYQFFRKFLPPPSAKISARYHVPGDRLSVPRILILILQSFPPADAIHNGLGILLTVWASFHSTFVSS